MAEPDQNEERPGIVRIPLDGTYGAGADAELVIVLKNEDGRHRETSYTVPYWCIDLTRIQRMCDMNLILGYRIVKGDGPTVTGLKELGL